MSHIEKVAGVENVASAVSRLTTDLRRTYGPVIAAETSWVCCSVFGPQWLDILPHCCSEDNHTSDMQCHYYSFDSTNLRRSEFGINHTCSMHDCYLLCEYFTMV